jgi:pimeloyl-ACP methyl ester carboxylesterase
MGRGGEGTVVSISEPVGALGRAGIVAAAGAAVVAGAAIGIAAERGVAKRLLRRNRPESIPEPYGSLRGRVHRVIADDGISLHVEVDEPRGADHPAHADGLTVVLCHGYALEQAAWHHQRKALRSVARVVTWDQRSHGRSQRAAASTHIIEHLAQDLSRVLDAVAPHQPVILVGHSMGGMTTMALADARPELFGDRIRGVALIASSAGSLADVPLGLPHVVSRITRPIVPSVANALVSQKEIVERTRRAASDLALVLTRRYSFGSEVPAETVEFVNSMLAATPIDVVAEFLPTFDEHERSHALEVLQQVETLVLVGARDLLTPEEHSHRIVRYVPGADLHVIPDSGHMVMLEKPEIVNGHLLRLVEHVRRHLA